MALPIETTDHIGKTHRYVLCSVYHPTGASGEEQATFEEMLAIFYREVGKKGNIISGNNCNAQVGTSTCDNYFDQETGEDDNDIKGTLGPHGLRRTNQKGCDLTYLLKERKLCASTTFRKHNNYCTWRCNFECGQSESDVQAIRERLGLEEKDAIPSDLDKKQFQLDHIFIEQPLLESLVDAKVTTEGVRSDHLGIRSELRMTS